MTLQEILIPLGAMLGGAGFWSYMQYRLKNASELKKYEKETSTDNMYRDDLKNRVRNLEELLAKSSDEKDEMRERIESLIGEVNALRVEVEYLKKENEILKAR